MPAGQEFVASLNNQLVPLIVEPFARMVRGGSRFLQSRVGGYHFTGNQIAANAEMLERSLGLSTPQLVRGHFNHTKAVALLPHVCHVTSLTVVCCPRSRSDDFQGPIFRLALFDSAAVSTTGEEVGHQGWKHAERRHEFRYPRSLSKGHCSASPRKAGTARARPA